MLMSTSCLSSTAEDRNASGGLPPTLDVQQPAVAAVGLSHTGFYVYCGLCFQIHSKNILDCVSMHAMLYLDEADIFSHAL